MGDSKLEGIKESSYFISNKETRGKGIEKLKLKRKERERINFRETIFNIYQN